MEEDPVAAVVVGDGAADSLVPEDLVGLVGAPSGVGGDVPVAASTAVLSVEVKPVVLKAGKSAEVEELQAWVKDRMRSSRVLLRCPPMSR